MDVVVKSNVQMFIIACEAELPDVNLLVHNLIKPNNFYPPW